MSGVSIVIPTYNERENIKKLVPLLGRILKAAGIKGEIIVVDDNSPDGTGKVLDSLKKKYSFLKVMHRSGKLGLASAVLDGFSVAGGSVLCVMDADFSHPLEKIVELILPVLKGGADVAVGSRYIRGGGIKKWHAIRRIISRGATVLVYPLTKVSDPVSGFFAIRRDVLEGAKINPRGFKILLEILVKGKHSKVAEVPFVFEDRKAGKSKLNMKIMAIYLVQVLSLYKWRFLSEK